MDLVYHTRPIKPADTSIYTPFAIQLRRRWSEHTTKAGRGRWFFELTRRNVIILHYWTTEVKWFGFCTGKFCWSKFMVL
jgi:hypothetical protein